MKKQIELTANVPYVLEIGEYVQNIDIFMMSGDMISFRTHKSEEALEIGDEDAYLLTTLCRGIGVKEKFRFQSVELLANENSSVQVVNAY